MDIIRPMDRCPLVLIEWLDSRQPSGGWNRLSSYEPAGACVCPALRPIGLGSPHLGFYGFRHGSRIEQAQRRVQMFQGSPEL
jgi:hypothetical protein